MQTNDPIVDIVLSKRRLKRGLSIIELFQLNELEAAIHRMENITDPAEIVKLLRTHKIKGVSLGDDPIVRVLLGKLEELIFAEPGSWEKALEKLDEAKKYLQECK